VVELELLERGECPVALLLELEATPLGIVGLGGRLLLGRRVAQERPGHEPHRGDGQQRAEGERCCDHGYASGRRRP
jgi:hypothetical protein